MDIQTTQTIPNDSNSTKRLEHILNMTTITEMKHLTPFAIMYKPGKMLSCESREHDKIFVNLGNYEEIFSHGDVLFDNGKIKETIFKTRSGREGDVYKTVSTYVNGERTVRQLFIYKDGNFYPCDIFCGGKFRPAIIKYYGTLSVSECIKFDQPTKITTKLIQFGNIVIGADIDGFERPLGKFYIANAGCRIFKSESKMGEFGTMTYVIDGKTHVINPGECMHECMFNYLRIASKYIKFDLDQFNITRDNKSELKIESKLESKHDHTHASTDDGSADVDIDDNGKDNETDSKPASKNKTAGKDNKPADNTDSKIIDEPTPTNNKSIEVNMKAKNKITNDDNHKNWNFTSNVDEINKKYKEIEANGYRDSTNGKKYHTMMKYLADLKRNCDDSDVENNLSWTDDETDANCKDAETNSKPTTESASINNKNYCETASECTIHGRPAWWYVSSDI